MTVSVSDLCELTIFKEGFELVAGKDGLDKNVQHVTIAEVPDFTDFDLGSQLFVLTTLYAFSNNLTNATNQVIQLCEKRISALAIKVDRFINEIPADIIKVANEYSVPLFTVKKNIAFRTAIIEISSEIIDSQLKSIRSLNQQHETLMSLILKGDKIETFVEILGENLGCSCLCLSSTKTVLSQYLSADVAQVDIDLLIAKLDDLPDLAADYTCIEEYFVFPCCVHNKTMGYLIIKPTKLMQDPEILLVKQMISFLSIKFLEEHLRIETEQRMITAIVDQILFNRYSDEFLIRDRVKLLGLTPLEKHFIIILSPLQENGKDSLQFTYHYWESKLKSIFPNSGLFIKGSELIAIVSLGENSPFLQEGAITRSLRKFTMATGLKDERHADFGFSLLAQDLRGLPDCYEQARKALKFGKTFKPAARIFPYSEFIEKGLISHGLGSCEHKEITNNIINPIKEYDKRYNTALWLTLEKCLFAKTLENAAQELNIHSSTLRYRLQKVADITRTDFFTPSGNFTLKLAYILSKIDLP